MKIGSWKWKTDNDATVGFSFPIPNSQFFRPRSIRRAFLSLSLGAAACGPRPAPPSADAPAPRTVDLPRPARSFERVTIAPDGRIFVGSREEPLARAEELAALDDGTPRWLTTTCAPTEAAIGRLVDVDEIARSRGWFVVARVQASAATLPAPAPRAAPPALIRATVRADGRIELGAARRDVPPEEARSLLPEGCRAHESIALAAAGASPGALYRAAGFLAALGCEVVILRGS